MYPSYGNEKSRRLALTQPAFVLGTPEAARRKLAGKTAPFISYACKVPGCWRGPIKPIKQIAGATGQLFIHLNACQPDLCRRLRSESKFSPYCVDADGAEYRLYNFEELLPHHARYVQKCFRGLDHFDESRADNGLVEYVQGYNQRASLPCAKTCSQLLEVRAPLATPACHPLPLATTPGHLPTTAYVWQVYEELVDEKVFELISHHKATYGVPVSSEDPRPAGSVSM